MGDVYCGVVIVFERSWLLALKEVWNWQIWRRLVVWLVWAEVWRRLADIVSELRVLLVNALDEAITVRSTLNLAGNVAGKSVQERVDLRYRVCRRRLGQIPKGFLSLCKIALELVLYLRKPDSCE